MKRKLKSFLSTALLVLSSCGTSFGRSNNYKNYGTEFNRHELSDLYDDDEDEIYYGPHNKKNSKGETFTYGSGGLIAAYGLWRFLRTLHSRSEAEFKIGSENETLKPEKEKNNENAKPIKENTEVKREKNTDVISFADEKKEINKISLHNIGNTCYMNAFVQTVLQFPRLVELIDGVEEEKVDERLKNKSGSKSINALKGIKRLIKQIKSGFLSKKDWKECAALMGWDGQPDSADYPRSLVDDALVEYYDHAWGNSRAYQNKKNRVIPDSLERCNLIFTPKNIESIKDEKTKTEIPIVRDKFDIVNLFTKDFNSSHEIENDNVKKMKKRPLCANYGVFQISIPSLSDGMKLDGDEIMQLSDLEDNFEEFELEGWDTNSIGIDFNKTVKRAKFTLKSIMLRVDLGHWYSISKNDDGYYLHDDDEIRKIDKGDVINRIKKHPVGATFMYSVSEAA